MQPKPNDPKTSNGGRGTRRAAGPAAFGPAADQQVAQGTRRRAEESASLPDDGVAHQPRIDRGVAAAAAGSRGDAGRHPVRRQADHRQCRAAGAGAA